LYAGPFIDQSPNPVSIAVHADQLIAYSTTAPISEPRPPSINCGGKYVTKLDQSGKTIFVKSIPWNGTLGIDASGNAVFFDFAFNSPADVAVDRVDITANTQAGAMCVLNAASLMRPRAVAPGEIVTVFGSGMGPAAGVVFRLDSNARVPTDVGGTRVLFNGVPGPVLYASDTQVNAIVPFGAPAGTNMEVTVEYQGQQLPPYRTVVSASEPDIFTLNAGGSGEAVAFNQDGTPNSDQNPAAPGSIVTIFLTGLGDTHPSSIEGTVATSIAPTPIAPFSLGVGGPPAQIEYIGPSPGSLSSITQVNFRIPGYAVPGPIRYQLIAGKDEWGPLRQVVVAVR
jgi:uncharacterized protein (TIGR03437 family)